MKSNQDRPEKFDKEIDAALKMLSETVPPAAMLSRVHQSLETRSPRLSGQRQADASGYLLPALR